MQHRTTAAPAAEAEARESACPNSSSPAVPTTTHLRVVAAEQQDGEGGGSQAAGPPRHLLLEEQGHLHRAKEWRWQVVTLGKKGTGICLSPDIGRAVACRKSCSRLVHTSPVLSPGEQLQPATHLHNSVVRPLAFSVGAAAARHLRQVHKPEPSVARRGIRPGTAQAPCHRHHATIAGIFNVTATLRGHAAKAGAHRRIVLNQQPLALVSAQHSEEVVA